MNKPPDAPILCSVEAEEAVLGSVLIDPGALYDLLPFLQAADFFIVRNSWVFDAFLRLNGRREHIDYLTTVEELRTHGRLDEIGGAAYITHLLNSAPSAIYAEAYGRIVQRAAVRRRLLEVASDIAKLAHDEERDIGEVIDTAESRLAAVTGLQRRDGIQSMGAIASAVYDQVEAAQLSKTTGIPTGFTDVDTMMGGLQKSDFVIVAGRPGMGKTSWLLSVALHAARLRQRVAMFSLEMSPEQLAQRLIAMDTGLNTKAMRTGKLSDHEFGLFTQGVGKIADLPIYIDDTPSLTPTQFQAKAARLYNEYGVGLIIVDYLQLMTARVGRDANRVQEVSEISRSMKMVARELNIPVLAAAQLSRAVEQRADKHPVLSDLRESGSLEQDADIVMFLYREDVYVENSPRPNVADVIFAKHRNGPTGTVSLWFNKPTTLFTDMRTSMINLKGA